MSGQEISTIVLLAVGTGFVLLAAIGVLRFPDVYTRMHAVTKAGSVGVAFCMAGVVSHFAADVPIWTRALLVIAFTLLTSPTAAQMMGRAAYATRVPRAPETHIDELSDHYEAPEALFEASPSDPPDEAG